MGNAIKERRIPVEPGASIMERLFSKQFFRLMAAAFLAYANISVFFGFVDHLRDLSLNPAHDGVLIGALAAVALIVRPILSPFVHSGNARSMLFLGTALVSTALAGYGIATAFWSLLAVRALHGLAFAVLGTGLMTLIVEEIPKDKSAQFFGYLSVVTLLPNTLVPPLLPFLSKGLGGFGHILWLFSALTLLIPLLAWTIGAPKDPRSAERLSAGLSGREIIENLRNVEVLRILFAMLLLYSGHALVFFFLDGFSRSLGIPYGGLFLTLSTLGEIGIRVAAGSVFDRMPKTRLAAWTLVGLGIAYVALAHGPAKWGFLFLGGIFGLGWGVAMPVFNGLMFDVSAPKFRAFNINLGLQMFQAGFFLGPIIGAPWLAGWGYGSLYHFCAALSLVGALLLFTKGVFQHADRSSNRA